ncbi:hypothetical protein KC315_g6145 [Hortaea werneckii]|nr:hypothetical protein KC315_g6145 [Hortaea werneckii]KAI7363818.1 hypothetical protein KC354_g6189 [Hortaea werneckii]
MTDPITAVGAIASVIQLIDFSARLLARLIEYRSKDNELPSAFMHIHNQLPLLREVLEKSREGINSQIISQNEVKAIEPCLRGCQQQIEKLTVILSAILPEDQDNAAKRFKKGIQSMWKESEVKTLEDEIGWYVTRLTFYYAWSSSRLDLRNHDLLARIQQWLSPPDPQLNFRKSLKLRSEDTGKWYLQGTQYEAWKAERGSFTWLYGSPGTGKTILSAGIIEDLKGYCDIDPARSFAFFFFDFNDAEKQHPMSMVRSLVSQFLSQCTHVPEGVRALHATCKREASGQQLLQALRDTLDLLPAPFIVLDALDECNNWEGLFNILQEMQRCVHRFRWAACQLDALAQCVTRGKVRRALQDLPKTLDETYARILRAIDEGQNAEEAVKILIWLACAERPLTAIEVCQVTGIVIGEECLFDEDEVLQDSTDILRICSSFVSIAIVGDNGMDDNDSKDDDSAYSEDQDSGMIREGVTHAAKQILEENCTDVNKLWINDDNPLHAASSRGHEKIVEILLAGGADVNAQGGYYNNALHAASDRGFDGVVSMLLAHGANVDAQGDRHGTALHAASDRGRKTIVQMLTAKGADVNAQGGYFGNALQAASHRGHEEIVRMLLAAGADVNAQGGEYGNALQAALVAGEGNVVQMLLDALANPPAIRLAV